MNRSIWSKIIDQAEEVADTVVQSAFFGKDYEWKRPSKNEVRKFSYETFKALASKGARLTQSIIIENTYLIAKDIREDQTLSDKEKIDLLFGEIEILLLENSNQMYKKHGDGKVLTIEHIRETHKVLQ